LRKKVTSFLLMGHSSSQGLHPPVPFLLSEFSKSHTVCLKLTAGLSLPRIVMHPLTLGKDKKAEVFKNPTGYLALSLSISFTPFSFIHHFMSTWYNISSYN
jgi:hypothetical protein